MQTAKHPRSDTRTTVLMTHRIRRAHHAKQPRPLTLVAIAPIHERSQNVSPVLPGDNGQTALITLQGSSLVNNHG